MQIEVLTSTVVLLVLLSVAAYDDVIENRISNTIVVFGIVIAMVLGGIASGVSGVVLAFAGLLIGGFLLLPFYILTGMAAGDVKLMAMVGAFLGPSTALLAVLATMIAGGIIAAGAFAIWMLATSKPGYVALQQMQQKLPTPLRPPSPGERPTDIPFALAILAGSIFAVVNPLDGALAGVV